MICSTATRCVETWQGLEQLLKLGIKPEFDRKLYHANGGVMLEKLQEAAKDVVLMLGHNPGVSAFAEDLLETVPNSRNFYNYPAAATTVTDFDIEDWSEIRLGAGKLFSFAVPRDLGI